MATTNLTRTPGSTGSTTKATLSAWVKKADITTTQDIYSLRLNNDNQLRLRLRDNGAITIYISVSNSTVVEKRSTRLLRDTSGWYHVVLVTDLTESAAEDKYKITPLTHQLNAKKVAAHSLGAPVLKLHTTNHGNHHARSNGRPDNTGHIGAHSMH